MKSNYWVMLLCLLASGFIGCSDDDGDNWKKTFEDEQARIKDFVYSNNTSVIFLAAPRSRVFNPLKI